MVTNQSSDLSQVWTSGGFKEEDPYRDTVRKRIEDGERIPVHVCGWKVSKRSMQEKSCSCFFLWRRANPNY